ncbi:hypothetical protein THAOC_24428 [Thalassiosira oceanica]|uniref:Uncharacterized protein n=1 Tax=Thalassiosira oceanica TaxID=159749 RepID=K0SAP2_THAOC|nr:hypothetical protein THAOC_24428 [Thalassiosira oceanica]|eukprot:EJK55797.1 hypothetical protein THAOC_24428 [Thalassiosira oceanica]
MAACIVSYIREGHAPCSCPAAAASRRPPRRDLLGGGEKLALSLVVIVAESIQMKWTFSYVQAVQAGGMQRRLDVAHVLSVARRRRRKKTAGEAALIIWDRIR